jgi:hypothetical protein
VTADGYLRFYCPCGRRLKVRADDPRETGKCPDCGRVVPVPVPLEEPAELPPGHPEYPTEDLSSADLVLLERWSRNFVEPVTQVLPELADEAIPMLDSPPLLGSPPGSSATKLKTALGTCPQCGRLVHSGANFCLECGARLSSD